MKIGPVQDLQELPTILSIVMETRCYFLLLYENQVLDSGDNSSGC